MELFERMEKHGVPNVRITPEEWQKYYANTYNILSLDNDEQDLIFAAQDIIQIYLLRVAEQKEQK